MHVHVYTSNSYVFVKLYTEVFVLNLKMLNDIQDAT